MSAGSAKLNLTGLAFDEEQVRKVEEILRMKLLVVGEITDYMTVLPGQVGQRELGLMGGFGIVGTGDKGCTITADNEQITATPKTITPTIWDIYVTECYKNLEATASMYAMRTGTAMSDLTGTDWEAIIVEAMYEAIKKMMVRLAWFSEKDAAVYTSGGHFTDGTTLTKWNLIDGLWKQLITLAGVYTGQVYTISKNAGNSYANQALASGDAKAALMGLWTKMPAALRQQPDVIGLMTNSLFVAYWNDMAGTINIESQLTILENGLTQVKIGNVPFIVMPYWDELIDGYQNNGTVWYKPHRALITTKSNLLLAVDSTVDAPFSDFRTDYDFKTREWVGQAQGRIDAVVLQDNLFALAI